MSFGDIAQRAFEKAVAAYEASVRVSEILNSIRDKLRDYEDRSERKLGDFEGRLREMESRMARLEGKVDGTMAEAFRVAVLAPENRDRLHGLATATLGQATSNGPTDGDPTARS